METNLPNTYPEEESIRRRTELFNQYVIPHKNLVYKLCIRYSFYPEDVEDNYNEALVNFFKYIESYDPSRPIQTWLHIVTKRFINDLNYKSSFSVNKSEGVDVSEIAGTILTDDEVNFNFMDLNNYHQFYNDDILRALNKLKPIYREALLFQQAGYKLHEIMEISYRNGNLKTRNMETIKSRLFLAKTKMRELIDRDGNSRKL